MKPGLIDMERLFVEIADFKIARKQGILETLGLGSCVGVMLYDPVSRIGGLAHIMLSDSARFENQTSPNKFADIGIRNMLRGMRQVGALKSRLTARIAGGAYMFESVAHHSNAMDIGARNVAAVKKVLSEEGIPLAAEDTGKSHGRSVEFHVETGKIFIRSEKYGVKELL